MRLSIGAALAGRRVTLRLDGTVMHVLDAERALLATRPCPIPATGLARLQGAHPAGPAPALAPAGPVIAERIVSRAGTFMLAGQKVTVGKQHARAVVQVVTDTGEFRVFHAGALTTTVARTTETIVTRRWYNENQRRAG